MPQADSVSLRERFNEDAELYDRARPRYVPELFDDLAALANLRAGARVLEIGCGTGQATRSLAERGYVVTAVELGASMAAVARRNLERFPSVTVVNAAFEEWPLSGDRFDLVLSATAFHWIDPAVRLRKTSEALAPGGALAIISTEHIAGGTEPFFVDVQGCYERWDPTTPPGLRLQPASEFPTDSPELDNSGLFEPALLRRYEWEQTYSTAEYCDVLRTYSDQRARSHGAELLECIAELIDTRYNGTIRKRYLFELRVARRR